MVKDSGFHVIASSFPASQSRFFIVGTPEALQVKQEFRLR